MKYYEIPIRYCAKCFSPLEQVRDEAKSNTYRITYYNFCPMTACEQFNKKYRFNATIEESYYEEET